MQCGSTSSVAQKELGLPAWAWVEDYLACRHSNADTLDTQLWGWRVWKAFLAENAIVAPADVTRELAGKFFKWRIGTVRRVTAINNVHLFHSVMEEAVLRQLCPANPLRRLRLSIGPVPEKPEVSPALEQEIREAIDRDDTIHRDFLRISMDLGIYQGRRIAETRLPLRNVDFEANTIQFWVKGQKWHTAPLVPRVRSLLLPLREAGRTWTFEHPSKPDRFSFIWHTFLNRHGFIERYPRLCFHSFRVTCVSRLARAGVTESKAMKFIGHSSLLVHRVYMRLQVEDLSDCVNALK